MTTEIQVDHPRPDFPTLLLRFPRLITRRQIEQIRHLYATAKPGQPLIFDGGIEVYQLIDGRWEPLNQPPNPGPEPRDP